MLLLHEIDDVVVAVVNLLFCEFLENALRLVLDLFLRGAVGLLDVVLQSFGHQV